MNAVLDSIDTGLALSASHVSVYFAKDGEKLDFVTSEGRWTKYERAQVMEALEAWGEVADLTFAVTNDAEDATFKLTKSPSEHGSLGFMNVPDPGYGAAQGIAWFNTYHYWGKGLLDAGSYSFTILLHEFGHGLGLAHPHDTGNGSGLMPQVGDGLGLDQGAYTVMTYNDGWPEAPEGTPGSRAWGWNNGPSAIDIAVMQAKYGANTTTGAGDSVYVLPSENASGTGYRAIWDVGGSDTLVARGDGDAVIDLRAATLKAEVGGGGWVSHIGGIHGGFTIAHGVVIEGATGGAGNDLLRGNGAANALAGRGGADRLIGAGGRDTLEGGIGRDRLNGGSGADVLYGGAGRDVLTGGAGRDVFVFASGGGRDRVTDFGTGDVLDLTGFALESFDAIETSVLAAGLRIELHGAVIVLSGVWELEADMVLL